jgi:hypothetical protein
MADDFVKDPGAKLDYHFDWEAWLEQTEVITASEFQVSSGLTVTDQSFLTTNTTVWLEGGRSGQVYNVTNRITTTEGRIDERSVTIRVRDR